jgi:hypothetical protein
MPPLWRTTADSRGYGGERGHKFWWGDEITTDLGETVLPSPVALAFQCSVCLIADHARRTGPTAEAYFQFVNWLIAAVERFPKPQKFLLGDRIQNTALDILESLIEATYPRDRRGHLMRANLRLEKLRFLFRQGARAFPGPWARPS